MAAKESTTRSATTRDRAAFLPRRSPMFSYLLVLASIWCQGQSCDISNAPIPAVPGTVVDNTLKPQGDGDEQVLGYTPPGPLSTQTARPSNLIAEAAADGSVLLTWADNSFDEEGFIVRRYDSTAVWTDYATVAPDTTTYVDAGVEARKTYCYQIVAFNAAGTGTSPQRCVRAAGPASSPDSALPDETAAVAAEPPLSPSGLAVAPSGAGELTLTWADNAVDEAGFVVRRYNGRAGWEEIGRVPADAASFVDATVSPGQSYCYQVAAFTETLQSRYSTTACAKADVTPLAGSEEPPGEVDPTVPPTHVRISGSLRSDRGNLQGVTLTIVGTTGTSQVTASSSYSIEVPVGWSGVIIPKLEGYLLDPPQALYQSTLMSLPGQDFQATALFAPAESVLARTEEELRSAEVLARSRDLTILLDREISMERGLRFGSRSYSVALRGTTSTAGIRFTRRWDGNWQGDITGENGLEFASPNASLKGLRIRGYEWRGSAIKFHGNGLLHVQDCVFEDISTLSYATSTGLPATDSTEVWWGNCIGGLTDAHLMVDRCTFRRVATSDAYAHCIYPLTAKSVIVTNSLFEEVGQPVKTVFPKVVQLSGNTYRNLVKVPYSRRLDNHSHGVPAWTYWVYVGGDASTGENQLTAINESFVNATFRWPIRNPVNSARHFFDFNDYSGLLIRDDAVGTGRWLPWISPQDPGMDWRDWRQAGFDQHSVPPPGS